MAGRCPVGERTEAPTVQQLTGDIIGPKPHCDR